MSDRRLSTSNSRTINKNTNILKMEPDMAQLLISDKALTVIFILLICLINGALIVTQVRKPMFYQKVKLMMIISLAIGDIFFALFPLVVQARLLFEDDKSFMTCRLSTNTTTYMSFLIHFVYGLGLVVLAAEVFLRNRIQSIHDNRYKIVTAVAASSVPWILGLIIILPLCMSNVDYESYCINSQSLESMFGVSVFLPVSLSIVVSIVLSCVHLPTSQQGQAISTNQQPIVVSQQTVAQQGHLTQYPPQDYAPGNVHYNPLNSNPYPQNAVSYPYPANQQVMNQSSAVNINLNQGVSTIQVIPMNQRAEGQRLFLISIIFGLMVVPISAVTLRAADIFWLALMVKIVVTKFVYWLMVARSCLTPLIMIGYSNL
uniref:G-protein coupled receptors family 1 profile domain-containing protein n=1 Tax=Biomphalaria glabrata TaxID=6526 RepID=A0A2C9L2F1_BIOGL